MDTNKMKNQTYSDTQFITALKEGNEQITSVFFYKELRGLLCSIQANLFQNKVEYDELVSELYLYLSSKNWSKLNTFSGVNGCHLRSWMSPVAWRFFFKKMEELSEKESHEDDLINVDDHYALDMSLEIRIDVQNALAAMSNPKYVKAIEMLIIEGLAPKEVAKEWHTTVANVYNIKLRAIKQFIDAYGK